MADGRFDGLGSGLGFEKRSQRLRRPLRGSRYQDRVGLGHSRRTPLQHAEPVISEYPPDPRLCLSPTVKALRCASKYQGNVGAELGEKAKTMWNNLKTTFLLAAMTGLVLGIGEWWGGQNGLISRPGARRGDEPGQLFLLRQDRAGLLRRASRFRARRTRAFTRLSSAWPPRRTSRFPRSISFPPIRPTRLPRAETPATPRWR